MKLWKTGGLLIGSFVLLVGLAGAQDSNKETNKEKESKSGAVEKTDSTKKDGSKGDVAKGKEVFEANCAICHNADSVEDKVGPGLKGLFKKPPHKMADGSEHKEHTIEMIHKQIVEGSSAMPPVGASLSEKEINDLIAYLQSL